MLHKQISHDKEDIIKRKPKLSPQRWMSFRRSPAQQDGDVWVDARVSRKWPFTLKSPNKASLSSARALETASLAFLRSVSPQEATLELLRPGVKPYPPAFKDECRSKRLPLVQGSPGVTERGYDCPRGPEVTAALKQGHFSYSPLNDHIDKEL
ncbi:unnamed protein product [Leuciscus chuanchicus]